MKTKLLLVAIGFFTASLFVPLATATKENKAGGARQAKITMAEARKTALSRIPGNVEKGELEREKGRLWFEFEIHKTGSGAEAEIHIDAVTGEVGDVKEESGGGSAKENEMFNAAKVSWDDAEAAALNRVPGAVVKEELERERGKVLYEFEIVGSDGKEMQVHVDAANGEVESVGKK